MKNRSRRNAPEPAIPAEPAAESDTAAPLPRGASDATLIIFLAGVVLMLMICVVFILIAS